MAREPLSELWVEGPDDREVIYQICNTHGLDNRRRFEVKVAEGVDELLTRAAVPTSAPAVGYVLDADGDVGARWEALRSRMLPRYPSFPEAPVPGGVVIPRQPGGPSRLGVWLMPDNRLPGAIEDLLLQLAPAGDPLLPYAESVLDGLPARRFGPTDHSKAKLHTWLAWQEEPGTRPGLALVRRYLDIQHPEIARFAAWLRALFTP